MQLTFRDIEKAFEIDEKTLYQWLNAEGLPAVKANGQYFFNSVEVLEWALKKRIRLTPGTMKLCEKNNGNQGLVAAALRRGGIHFGLKESSRDAVLSKAIDLLPLPAHVPTVFLKEMLVSREQAGSTGVGDAIAIPHVKHPVVLAGMEPMLGLFFLDNAIDFAAIDGLPVNTLFVILSPSFKEHLSLLSRLAYCLQDQTVKTALNDRDSADAIMTAFHVTESKTAKAAS